MYVTGKWHTQVVKTVIVLTLCPFLYMYTLYQMYLNVIIADIILYKTRLDTNKLFIIIRYRCTKYA